jgi:LPXTG-motif cell wall-anchored protein
MSARYLCSAIIAALLMCGVDTVVPARVYAQQPTFLPEGGMITLVGCLGFGGKHDKYLLVNPTVGSIVSVPDGTCTATDTEQAVELKDTSSHYQSMLGRMVEISGRLERIEGSDDPDDLRELHVESFREVPVVPPRIVEAAPPSAPPPVLEPQPPAPQAEAPAIAEEKPVATTGTAPAPAPAPLPKTASGSSLIGVLGLLSLAGALGLRLFHRERAAQ